MADRDESISVLSDRLQKSEAGTEELQAELEKMQVRHDEYVTEKETFAKQMDDLKAKCVDYGDLLAERDDANNVLKDQLAKSEVDRAEHESTLLVVRAELEATKVQLNEREEQYDRQMEETLAQR